MILMTDKLFDEINEMNSSSGVSTFRFLTENVEQKILQTIGKRTLAYAESEFFGGQGGHIGVVWKNGKRDLLTKLDKSSMNKILTRLGARRTSLKDEFEAVGLAKQRRTEDWIE